jgi:hypothetical protein
MKAEPAEVRRWFVTVTGMGYRLAYPALQPGERISERRDWRSPARVVGSQREGRSERARPHPGRRAGAECSVGGPAGR